jgi:Sigma-70 region 2
MDEAELQHLHARLVDGDRTASRDVVRLVDAFVPRLLSRLRGKWPRATHEVCEEAVLEALFNYLNAPHSYDPSRGRLARYLFWSAHRDLQNLLDREGRQRLRHTRSLDRIELDAACRTPGLCVDPGSLRVLCVLRVSAVNLSSPTHYSATMRW